MKVILVKDVENQGRMGDVKEVAPGYARNFLLPRGLAVQATPGQMKQIEVLQTRRVKEDARRLAEAKTLGERLSGLSVTVRARVGEGGRLFGSVTNLDVAASLKDQHGIEIDRRDVDVEDPIRMTGEHSVVVRLGGQVQANLKVIVVNEAEEGNGAASPEAAAV